MEDAKHDVEWLPLIGTEEATMDDKGRILIGIKMRQRLGPKFAMTLGSNGSINVLSKHQWQALYRTLQGQDRWDKARHNWAQLVFGSASDEMDFDAQGRVVIPKQLREWAEIEDKVVIVGMGDHLELWNKFVYSHEQKHGSRYMESLESSLAEPRLPSRAGQYMPGSGAQF